MQLLKLPLKQVQEPLIHITLALQGRQVRLFLQVMSTNAVKAGINAYCLLEDNEYQKFLEELSKK